MNPKAKASSVYKNGAKTVEKDNHFRKELQKGEKNLNVLRRTLEHTTTRIENTAESMIYSLNTDWKYDNDAVFVMSVQTSIP